jgi:hypothetical protein
VWGKKAVEPKANHASDIKQVWAPQVFYTCFYNHAHRLRLEKLLYIELSGSSNGFFKPLLDPDGRFTSETAERRFQKLKRPLHGGFGSETDKNLTAIYLTGILQRTQVPVWV